MILGDTIAAIASAPGHTSRAVVRISGPLTPACLLGLIESPTASRGSSVVRITLAGMPAPIPCVLVRYVSPASYTGEDGAELILPGGSHIAGAVLDAFLEVDGVRRATPGEFTVRALLAGKLAPEQAESVGALIAARSNGELAAAHRVLTGESGGAYRELCVELTHALALVEAGIDFAEHEDVVAIPRADLFVRLNDAHEKLDSYVSNTAPAEHRSSEPLVVIAGPPNAGKSTLINRLAGWDRAIVSETPGTTRDVLEHAVDLHPGRVRVRLADTAGLDASLTTSSRAEAGAQHQSARAVERACVVVWCDPIGVFEGAPAGAILVRTKADLPCAEHPERVIDVCALDGRGIAALESEIAARAIAADPPGEWGVLPRHAESLRGAHACIADAIDLLKESPDDHLADPELIAQCMRSALDAIGTIVGDVTPDDIIGRIQSTFCVGK
jgi:tRNA modification GTPase